MWQKVLQICTVRGYLDFLKRYNWVCNAESAANPMQKLQVTQCSSI